MDDLCAHVDEEGRIKLPLVHFSPLSILLLNRSKGVTTFAEKRLSELLNQLDNGTFMKLGKTTLAEYLERWLKDYVWPNLAPRTAEGYEHICRRHIIPALGNMTLTGLKPEHLQQYQSEKLLSGRCDGKGGLGPRTVRHHHMALHNALEHAVKMGVIKAQYYRCRQPALMSAPAMADLKRTGH
ncbi:N-terminal phage integrase SAM-like domain-containing protein [Chloroflexota bacterium]